MIRFTNAQKIRKGKPRKASRQKSVLEKLNAFLTAKEPEAITFLVSFWDSQTRAVTYQELREAYLSGGITQTQFERWQQDYSELVRNQFYPQWQEAANAARNTHISIMNRQSAPVWILFGNTARNWLPI